MLLLVEKVCVRCVRRGSSVVCSISTCSPSCVCVYYIEGLRVEEGGGLEKNVLGVFWLRVSRFLEPTHTTPHC